MLNDELKTLEKTFIFDIVHPGDEDAGFWPFTDTVTVTVESGNPAGGDEEFMQYMRDCIADWYIGARVILRDPRDPK